MMTDKTLAHFHLLLHKMTVVDKGKDSGKLVQVGNFKESEKK